MSDELRAELARLYMEAMENESLALAERLPVSVQPTFIADEGGRPRRVGSCVLVQIDGCYFAVTARHVLDQAPPLPVYIGPVKGKLALLPSAFHFFTHSQDPSDDPLDIGAAVIPAARVADLHDCVFIDESMMASADEPLPERRPLREFLIFGYPASRKQSQVFQRQIKLTSFRFATSAALPERYTEVNVDPRSHVLLDYDHEKLFLDDKKITPPKLQGVSGGGVFKIGPGLKPTLVAIPTHHLKRDRLVRAVRIEVVKVFLRRLIENEEAWIFR